MAVKHSEMDANAVASSVEDSALMTPRIYEITFAGRAPPSIIADFEDFDVTVDEDTTKLRAELDQAALHGAIERMQNLGLELLAVRAVD